MASLWQFLWQLGPISVFSQVIFVPFRQFFNRGLTRAIRKEFDSLTTYLVILQLP